MRQLAPRDVRELRSALRNECWTRALGTFYSVFRPDLPDWIVYIDSSGVIHQTFIHGRDSDSTSRVLHGERYIWASIFSDRPMHDVLTPEEDRALRADLAGSPTPRPFAPDAPSHACAAPPAAWRPESGEDRAALGAERRWWWRRNWGCQRGGERASDGAVVGYVGSSILPPADRLSSRPGRVAADQRSDEACRRGSGQRPCRRRLDAPRRVAEGVRGHDGRPDVRRLRPVRPSRTRRWSCRWRRCVARPSPPRAAPATRRPPIRPLGRIDFIYADFVNAKHRMFDLAVLTGVTSGRPNPDIQQQPADHERNAAAVRQRVSDRRVQHGQPRISRRTLRAESVLATTSVGHLRRNERRPRGLADELVAGGVIGDLLGNAGIAVGCSWVNAPHVEDGHTVGRMQRRLLAGFDLRL